MGSSSPFTNSSLYSSSNEGMNFSAKFGSASTIWYPASGYRSGGVGGLNFVSSRGNYWSASLFGGSAYGLYYFLYDGYVYPSYYYFRACGYSVRCLQE